MNPHSSLRIAALPLIALGLTLALRSVSAQTTPAPPTPNQPPSPCGSAVAAPPNPAPAAPNKPVRVRANLCGFDISEKAGKSANQAGAASRGDSAPKLYAPVLGKTYSLNPQFHWQALDPDAKVTFHLMTQDGKTVYEAAALGGRFEYPASAPALMPGTTYRWTVIPSDDDLYAGLPAPVGFVVVSGTDRDAIAADLAPLKDPSAKADVYLKHRLWYDAIQAYSDILDRTPADQKARAARAQIYDQFPATFALADADWKLVR